MNRTRSQGTIPLGDAERLLYSMSVADLAQKPALVCFAETTARKAAQMMAGAGATSIFPVGSDGTAIGIVTHRDLVDKVMARGLSPELPLTRIMSSPVVSSDSGEPVFAVLVQMLSHHIHHVLITENGAPKAVITDHDLMILQRKSQLDDIEQQTTIEGLQTAQARVRGLVSFLMCEGEKASHITRAVAEINDRIVQKILEFAVSACAPPPVPFCWVALGSEGRREQTFLTDQDNALIYADIGNHDLHAAIENYFQALTTITRRSLEMCGYPPCPGGYMASNPRWRQPLCEWKRYFHTWIKDPTQERAKDALILFDMRPVAGDLQLYEELWQHIRELLVTSGEFKSILAWVSVKNKPPLGLFRTFVLERGGEHKHKLDLKLSGTGPIVNAARVFALDALIRQTNTLDRLNALGALNGADTALLHDMREAFEFLTLLRIEHQLERAQHAKPASNYIDPATLTPLQKSALKDAFQTSSRAQKTLEARFATAIWAQLRSQE